MTTRRFYNTELVFASGISITSPSLICNGLITGSNIATTVSRVANFLGDTVSCSNLILNNNPISFNNIANNKLSYLSTIDGPAIIAESGFIFTNNDQPLYWNNTSIGINNALPIRTLSVWGALKTNSDITMPANSNSNISFTSIGNFNMLTFYNGSWESRTPGYSGINIETGNGNTEINYAAAGYTNAGFTSTGSHVFFCDSYGISSGSNYTVRSAMYITSRTDGSSNVGIDYRGNSDDYIKTQNPLATLVVADLNSTNTPIAYFENQAGSTYMSFGRDHFMGHNTSIANSFTDNFFINNKLASGNHVFITSTGSLVNGRMTSLNNYVRNEPCIATSAGDGIGRGTFALGSDDTTGNNNGFIQTSNGNLMFNNGNSDYVTTTGNQTVNIATLTSNGSLLLPTTSSLIISNHFHSMTGTIGIAATAATYYITPGISTVGYMGYLTCIASCNGGRHVSMSPIIMPGNADDGNIRGYITGGSVYNFGTYTAFVEPYGGSNNNGYLSTADSPAKSVQFRVTAYATANTMTWRLTLFSLGS